MNPLHQSTAIAVKEFNEVGNARRLAVALGQDLEFDETAAGKVGIVATELANNLVKHAGGGTILLRVIKSGEAQGIEILSVDSGRGMENIPQCMQDGYSTAGSHGSGLGAIDRLSDGLEIYSQPGKGTVLSAKLWSRTPEKNASSLDIGAVCVPFQGEKQSGDGWAVGTCDKKIKLLVVDGLGHGDIAAVAANMAIELFEEKIHLPPLQLMQTLHAGLLSTRGAAAAIAEIDSAKEELTFCGIGNISGTIVNGPKSRGLASYNGTVGHQQNKAKEFVLPFPKETLIILHSDGLNTRWKLEDYPALAQKSANLIAGVLYRDSNRGRDDSTVLVMRGG